MTVNHERILCVDDEANVLDGLARTLRRLFNLRTAVGPEEGLKTIRKEGPFPVVMSDLRMPDMDGIEFLQKVREIHPDTVCLLLTGNADLKAALAAVNEGHIFRFLTKPCPGPILIRSLKAAEHQHRLLVSERVLLQETVRGCVRALCEVLAISAPLAFGRATRLERWVLAAAAELGQDPDWSLGIAAMLSQVGWVTAGDQTIARIQADSDLSPSERAVVSGVAATALRIAENIPRLEQVVEVIREVSAYIVPAGFSSRAPCQRNPARILAAALDFDARLNLKGLKEATRLLKESGHHDPVIVDVLKDVVNDEANTTNTGLVALGLLQPGVVFLQDVVSHEGQLLVTRGQTATPELLVRLKHLSNALAMPNQVFVGHPKD